MTDYGNKIIYNCDNYICLIYSQKNITYSGNNIKSHYFNKYPYLLWL